jgi:hypothetical protein
METSELLRYCFMFVLSLPVLLAIWVASSYFLQRMSHVLSPFMRWIRGLAAGAALVYLLIIFDIDGDHVLIMMWFAAQSARGDGELWTTLVRLVKGERATQA